MALADYATDLVDIDTGEAETTTGYVAYGGGGAGLGAGADFAMQKVNCIDKQITAAEKGILFNNGAGLTVPLGDHIFIWHFTATPGVCDSLINRGAVVCIGQSTTNFCKYHVEGKETFGAGGRVGKCYPVDPTVYTANTGASPYRTQVGTPNGTFQYFGSGLKTIASVKSANMGLDVSRYGKGAFITAGDVATPATFAGFAAQNDTVNNRWGILTDLGGVLELQGMFAVGQNSAGVATQAYFKDANKTINIADTVHSASDFTQFVLDHALTEAYWTNITINALGTHNRGLINVINGKLVINGGTLTGFGTTVLSASSTVDGHTWRESDAITTNGAALTNFLVDKSFAASALITDDLGDLTSGEFISDGTGYGVNLGTIAATSAQSWDCKEAGYVVGSAGTNVGLTPTGNETILVNVAAGQTLTVNVNSGASTPSIANSGTGQVDVVAGLLPINIKAKSKSTGLGINGAHVYMHRTDNNALITSGETDAAGLFSDSIAASFLSVDYTVWARQSDLLGIDYVSQTSTGTISSAGADVNFNLEIQD